MSVTWNGHVLETLRLGGTITNVIRVTINLGPRRGPRCNWKSTRAKRSTSPVAGGYKPEPMSPDTNNLRQSVCKNVKKNL